MTSVLAPIERRALIAMATRMPAWVNSDHLTVLALVSMFFAGLSYWLASTAPLALLLVVLFLAINWFGDSLDGTLARVRHHERPRYGFYVDHVVDLFGAAFLLGGLALSGYMSAPVAIALLVAYLMLCVEVFLATHTMGAFRMSYFKVGPTELRLLLALGNVVALFHPTAVLFGRPFLLFDIGGAIGAAGLMMTLLVAAVSNTRALYAAEPLRRETPR
ncbi:MAG: CDP-alcohol phosphatidyltransferase family protein [Acidobacteriota bacterium]